MVDGNIIRSIWVKGYMWFKENKSISIYANILRRTLFLPNNSKFQERLYCILYDVYENKTCYCGKLVKFIRFGKGYYSYCSVKCKANDKILQNKIKNSNMIKYGVNHISKIDYVKKLKKETLMTNFGVSSTFELWDKIKKEEAVKKWRVTRLERNQILDKSLLSSWDRYKWLVSLETNKSIKENKLDNIEKRGNHAINKKSYHVDHMVSKLHGFNNNIPPYIIGSIYNLQCIFWKDNLKKNFKSSITIGKLLNEYTKKMGQPSYKIWNKGICTRLC